MTAHGYGGYSCDAFESASGDGVTATQACSVACSGGDVTSCQEFDNCWDSPCLNGGVCTDGVGTFTCACPPPLASTTDAEDNCSDECAANPCLNGGVCVDGIGTFTCDCTNTGFCGRTCDDVAFAVQVQHGGQCPCEDEAISIYVDSTHRIGGGCKSLTFRGYYSYPCSQITDANGVAATQACIVACTGGDVTACPAYDNCWDSPCLNGGVCTDGTPSFTCACASHYGGPACETYSGPNQDIVRVCG